MKTYIWLGAGLAMALAGSVAMAQPAPPPPGGAGMETQGGDMGPHDGGRMGGPHGHAWMHDMMRHMGPMGHPPPPPSKAAHFQFRKGDAVVDIKCADDEPMKACVDAGSMLLDKVAAAGK